jgi:hypothetical protein
MRWRRKPTRVIAGSANCCHRAAQTTGGSSAPGRCWKSTYASCARPDQSSTKPSDPHGITEYELPGSERRVSAVTFSRFLEHLTDIDLDHVDPGLLAAAFGPLT